MTPYRRATIMHETVVLRNLRARWHEADRQLTPKRNPRLRSGADILAKHPSVVMHNLHPRSTRNPLKLPVSGMFFVESLHGAAHFPRKWLVKRSRVAKIWKMLSHVSTAWRSLSLSSLLAASSASLVSSWRVGHLSRILEFMPASPSTFSCEIVPQPFMYDLKSLIFAFQSASFAALSARSVVWFTISGQLVTRLLQCVPSELDVSMNSSNQPSTTSSPPSCFTVLSADIGPQDDV